MHQKECQKECQLECRIKCSFKCRILCVTICQVECLMVCQKMCLIECKNICQIKRQNIWEFLPRCGSDKESKKWSQELGVVCFFMRAPAKKKNVWFWACLMVCSMLLLVCYLVEVQCIFLAVDVVSCVVQCWLNGFGGSNFHWGGCPCLSMLFWWG